MFYNMLLRGGASMKKCFSLYSKDTIEWLKFDPLDVGLWSVELID